MTRTDTAPRHPSLDVELLGLDGRAARLGDHLGDPLIVFVWASW